MENKPKILVASPVFDGMKYCLTQFLDRIKELDYENYDILLFENSSTKDFYNELKYEPGIKVIRLANVNIPNMKKIIKCRNKIINYALENDYDYILMMDCDVIPPKNIISELMNCQKDIISGLYYNNFKIDGQNKVRPVVWRHILPREFEEIKNQLPNSELIQYHTDLRRFLTLDEANSNHVFKVRIPSAGCMLVKRNVIEKVRYGLLEIPAGFHTSDDIYFAERAEELGFEIFCNTKVKCDHLVEGKYESDAFGNKIHPAFK